MIVIVEPKEHIDSLWGKQRITDGETYRMMRYVLQVHHDGKVLLHNVITGQLVVLDQDEEKAVKSLPTAYSPVMEQLVTSHYLVPEDYDEHQQVKNLRTILRKLEDVQKEKGVIKQYTILPTTACNARCYYCFEQGVRKLTMTEETAKDVVTFIAKHCGKKREVFILWFGGEPTLGNDRIDQICKGLRDEKILIHSDMISNGYLLDEDVVQRAKHLWNLRHVQITIDGTEASYNAIKAYVNACPSPYQKIMQNIGYLIAQEIHVNVRMNIDITNHTDFPNLVSELKDRFGVSKYLHVYAYPIIGEYTLPGESIIHGTDEWFAEELIRSNDYSRSLEMGGIKRKLPFLSYLGCGADNNQSITITPEGKLTRCPEQFECDQFVGDIWKGITNHTLYQSWKEIADYNLCKDCCYYPKCVKMIMCKGKETCHFHDRNHQYIEEIKRKYNSWKENNK